MARISYLGMNHGEMYAAWLQETGTKDYTEYELRRIHVRWRSLGKRIANGDRIPEGRLGGRA